MCKFQVSWNFVYNIKQLKCTSLARNSIYNVIGVMIIRILSPSLATKCAYKLLVELLPNYLVKERFMASESIWHLGPAVASRAIVYVIRT